MSSQHSSSDSGSVLGQDAATYTDMSSPILIIGACPVGMLLAYTLSRLNIPSMLIEQSPAHSTTQYPKMDLTNSRSMEILRLLGLADRYRALDGAVSAEEKFDSIFVTSLAPAGKMVGSWRVGSVEDQRRDIGRVNDGSQPVEPGQRCSQIVFESWMRRVILQSNMVRFQGGWEFVGLVKEGDRVTARFVDLQGREHVVTARDLVGCDGGRSTVRRETKIRMVGGQVYVFPSVFSSPLPILPQLLIDG